MGEGKDIMYTARAKKDLGANTKKGDTIIVNREVNEDGTVYVRFNDDCGKPQVALKSDIKEV